MSNSDPRAMGPFCSCSAYTKKGDGQHSDDCATIRRMDNIDDVIAYRASRLLIEAYGTDQVWKDETGEIWYLSGKEVSHGVERVNMTNSSGSIRSIRADLFDRKR